MSTNRPLTFAEREEFNDLSERANNRHSSRFSARDARRLADLEKRAGSEDLL